MMNYGNLRFKARDALSGHWGVSVGVAALAALLGGLMLGASFLPEVKYTIPLTFLEEYPVFSEAFLRFGHLFAEEPIRFGNFSISFQGGVMGLAAFLIGGVLQLGYAGFLLKQHDRQQAEFNDLFSQFHRFGQGFAQKFLRSLYTFLWALLFVIPGIVASYRYAMTPYIMAEYPELTASEAIDRSKALMDGHKGELFVLRLTFLGWDLLAAISLNIGNLWLNPYKNAAEAAFYREITKSARTYM